MQYRWLRPLIGVTAILALTLLVTGCPSKSMEDAPDPMRDNAPLAVRGAGGVEVGGDSASGDDASTADDSASGEDSSDAE